MTECRPEDVRKKAFDYYRRLRRLDRYCRRHFRDTVTLQDAADAVALERTYFSSYFHDKVGVCFSCWLSILRVEEAKRLLRASDCLISNIALDVGFKSLTSFERAFKRCTGETPSSFRRHCQATANVIPKL